VPKSKRSGLPDSIGIRRDLHYVDLLSTRTDSPVIRMISTKNIDPSPQQARTELGNLQELMASIKEKGIIEPIIVRKKDERHEIIAGERRYVASKKLGLKEIPCIEMNVSDNEAMEIALIENIQRKDLNAFEEADGLKALSEMYGYSHDQIAKKVGKARSTVTEIVNISKIPEDVRNLCRENKIESRSTILEISKQKNKDDMYRLLYQIKKRELKREDTRDLSKIIKGKQIKEKSFVYNYVEKEKTYKFKLEIKKPTVTREEIIKILEDILMKLRFDKK
jgi:ParB family chromosome partitioning protein